MSSSGYEQTTVHFYSERTASSFQRTELSVLSLKQLRVRGNRWFAERIVHVENPPASTRLSAHRHAAPHQMFFGSDDFIVVGVPKRVTKELHVVQLHLVGQLGRVLQESTQQILHDLLAAAIFALKSKENNVRIKTISQLPRISAFERRRAVMHVLIHLLIGLGGTPGDRVDGRNAPSQINRHAHPVQQINT